VGREDTDNCLKTQYTINFILNWLWYTLPVDTVSVGNSSSMEKSRKVITSAGSYLVRKTPEGKYEIFIIHEKWPNGDETYCLPKGSKEKEESLEEAATRETTEESGYADFKILKYIGSRTYELDWDIIWIKTDHYFLTLLESEKKVKQNLVEYEKKIIVDSFWIDIEEGFKMLTNENQTQHHSLVRKFLGIDKN